MKEALKGDNEDAIKSAQEDLQNKFYEVSQKLYEAAQQAQGGAQAGPKGPQGAGYDPNAQAQLIYKQHKAPLTRELSAC